MAGDKGNQTGAHGVEINSIVAGCRASDSSHVKHRLCLGKPGEVQ